MTFHSLTPSLTTPDIQRCLRFYRDLLGFVCTSEMAEGKRMEWVELSHGAVRLMLLASHAPDAPALFYRAAGVIFYFLIDDVASVRLALEAAGHEVSPLEVTFYGMRECYVEDPDGRQLTLAEPAGPDDQVTITSL